MAKYAFIKMWWNDLSTFPPAARFRHLSVCPRSFVFVWKCEPRVRWLRTRLAHDAPRAPRLPAFNVRLAPQSEPCGRSLPLTARVETRPKQPTVADGSNAFTPRITLYTSLPSRRNGIVIILTVSIIIISLAFVNAFAGERAGGVSYRTRRRGRAGAARRAPFEQKFFDKPPRIP